jgi:Flp pilus assembly protein protease CpaA
MNLFFLLALLSLTIFVSLYDLRHARIPNWVTIPLFIIGLIFNSPHPIGIYVLLGSFWIAWKLSWMGGGDAKLWMGLVVYVLKAFGQFLMETFSLVGWIIHLSFVGAAGDVKPEFVL